MKKEEFKKIRIEDYWDKDWWAKSLQYDDISHRLKTKFPEIEWTKNCDDIRIYGDDETNDISISLIEQNFVESIHIRIDLSKIDFIFIDLMLEMAKDLKCNIADRRNNLFSPTREELSKSILESNAHKFVTNPRKFLDEFSKGKIDME